MLALKKHKSLCLIDFDARPFFRFHVALTAGGLGLSLTDRVSIRSGGCGAARTIQISLANLHGIANVTESVNASSTQGSNTSILGLSFGASDFTLGLDHRLSIDASVVGYDLCWCGLASCAVGDFVVPLGQLIVQGARTNQELRCPVGQECSLSSILTVDPQPGDRLMVLTACATGVSVKGFPGGGVAEHAPWTAQGKPAQINCSVAFSAD